LIKNLTQKLKKMIFEHNKLEMITLKENMANHSDDSDVLNEEVNSDIDDREDLEQSSSANIYIDQIEKVYVTFLSMETNDAVKTLFSPKEKITRRRCFLRCLADQGCLRKHNRRENSIKDLKYKTWNAQMKVIDKVSLNSNHHNKKSNLRDNKANRQQLMMDKVDEFESNS